MYKKKMFYLLYLVLFMLMLMRTSTDTPNILYRTAFLVTLLAPLFFIDKKYFTPILICFMTIGTYGFAFNYLPYEISIYFYITLLFLIFRRVKCDKSHISLFFVITVLFLLFRNILDSFHPQDVFYSCATVGVFSLISNEDRNDSMKLMLYSFAVISIGLSLLYLINYEKFIEDYSAGEGLERSGWMDPNYFSCVVGMGVMSSSILLMKPQSKRRVFNLCFLIATIILSVIVQVLSASRGGILAISLGVTILLIFSKVRLGYKILVVFFIFCFVAWMYQNNYFELLEYRLNNDDGTGSGRLDIWTRKLDAMASDGNILHWIIGYGYQSGFQLTGSAGNGVGFHNDFIAIFCEYGLLGLLIFLCYLCKPLMISAKENRPIVLALLLYLWAVCMTLEPFSLGYLPYFAFYYLVILVSKSEIKME